MYISLHYGFTDCDLMTGAIWIKAPRFLFIYLFIYNASCFPKVLGVSWTKNDKLKLIHTLWYPAQVFTDSPLCDGCNATSTLRQMMLP